MAEEDKKAKKQLEEMLKQIEKKEEKEKEKEDKEIDKQMREEEKEGLSEEEDKWESWKPKTELGRMVKSGKIKDIDEILDKGRKILEPEIVDYLIPDLVKEPLFIGQAKGKFGGGKRRAFRQTQRKTAEGNILTFGVMVVVGDKKGHVGIGYGRASETLPAKEKAERKAKLNLIKVPRGCGSFDCSCDERHSIPVKTEGKAGSVKIKLFPAPQGTGLVIGDEMKKILKAAGITDIYSQSFGKTRTTFNSAKALIQALNKINQIIE